MVGSLTKRLQPTFDRGHFIRSEPKLLLFSVLFLWSVFQLWYASPLPFIFKFFILNETQARAIHLAWPLGIVFLIFPFKTRLSKHPHHTPRFNTLNVTVSTLAVFCASYLWIFYEQLASRPGLPTVLDISVSVIGLILLLEAARRVLGSTLVFVAAIFLGYAFAGAYMPEIIAHKGASLSKAMNHYWLSTEGVFGIALGVSNNLVFMFVLFGALLEKAGAGNYFIRCAYALMGSFKAGPAKAAIAASALTGMISGSSTANVVTTGTFTIPLMRKVGFSAEKAGAIEVASSTNGQLMPPIMGAAAFLMAEYVGISYLAVVKHALVPALISYIALGFIVHIEACKLGLEGLPKSRPYKLSKKLATALLGFLSMATLTGFTYFGLGWIKSVAGDQTFLVISVILVAAYLALLTLAITSSCGCAMDQSTDIEPNEIPALLPTLRSGCYFLLPIIVLMWCLTVERLSPSLSAFWASCFLLFIVLTQRPIKALMLSADAPSLMQALNSSIHDALLGLVFAAKNMIPIAIATATAGLVVGTVTLTGVGFTLTELIEQLAGGNLLIVLILTAAMSLMLGMGLPTTANYIVVSTLMAPVIVHLGAQTGLTVPLIGAHLFVFYFGILADDTPPVGLAAYAAAGISGGNPIKTGLQGFAYDIRTLILPFVFLFNTELLLIGVNSWSHLVITVIASTIGLLVFCAATQRFLIDHNRLWETVALLLISAALLRPGFIWDRVYPPSQELPIASLSQIIESDQTRDRLNLRVTGEDFSTGHTFNKIIVLPLADSSLDGNRINNSGLHLRYEGDKTIIDNVVFDSPAQKAGFDFDQELVSVEVTAERPSKQFMFIPALLALTLIWFLQRRRLQKLR